jgi:hypothetical protein
MQRTDYRFTLTRDTDTFEVFPEGFFAGSFKYEQEEGQLFFRRNYNGELSFRSSDYEYIKSRYDAGNYCDIYELLIEKKVSGVYQVDWSGYFSMTDGKFDFEKCRYKVNPIVQDKYSCVLRNWENEYNILNLNKSTVYGYGQTLLFFVSYFDPAPPSSFNCGLDLIKTKTITYRVCDELCEEVAIGVTAGLYATQLKIIEKGVTPSGAGWNKWDEGDNCDQYLTAFIREKINDYDVYFRSFLSYNSAPGDDDVVLISDICQSDCSSLSNTPNDLGYTGKWYKAQSRSGLSFWVKSSFYNGYKIDTEHVIGYRGIKLTDAVKFLLNETCSSTYDLISDFLTSSTNPVTGISSKTNNIFLVQKSDAKKPSSSNPATIGNMSFEQMMNNLYSMFQLWWYIDDSDNIVIVHQSEIENNPGINITVSPYIAMTAHKKSIDFDKGLLYRFEKWTFMESKNEDFIGMPIEYAELCTIKDSNNKTKSYEVDSFTTDLAFIQTGFDKISDEGFLVVAADSSNYIINEAGEISGLTQINGHLSLANLHNNYWRHNRILSTGLMNGAQEIFLSTQKIRKLQEQQIVYCGEFDPMEQVTTELGNANVNEAEFFPLDNKLILNLSI